MTKRFYKDYLEDMINSIDEVFEFTEDLTYDSFYRDKKTVNAVVRSLEVLGEAGKKIPESIRRKDKDIPWKQICGMRDKLIHDYFGIDFEMIWKLIEEELLALKGKLLKIKDNQEKEV